MPKQQDDQQFEQTLQRGLPATMHIRRLAEHPFQYVGQHGQLIQGQHQAIG
ncbi:hypothetical protein D3C75_1135280 [compost metagenome]